MRLIVKYYPIIVNVVFLILSTLELTGQGDFSLYVYTLTGDSVILDILLLILSRRLNFCSWHRVLIYAQIGCLTMETLTNYGVLCYSDYVIFALLITLVGLITSIVKYKWTQYINASQKR